MIGHKREGDPSTLVADISRARHYLEWIPMYSLVNMIEDAWYWEEHRG